VNGQCAREELLDSRKAAHEDLAEIWGGLKIDERYCPYFIKLMPRVMVELYGTILLLSDDERVVLAVKLRLKGFEKDDAAAAKN